MQDKAFRSSLAISAITAVATSTALWNTGVRIIPGWRGFVLLATALVWMWIAQRCKDSGSRWTGKAIAVGNGFVLFSMITLCGVLLSYLAVRLSPFPYSDPLLLRADRSLGFDWHDTFLRYILHGSFAYMMQHFYLAIFQLPLTVIAGLALTGNEHRLEPFFKAFALALAITIAIFFFLPAMTPLIYLFGNQPPYVPATGIEYYSVINELRTAAMSEVELSRLCGLITFPSFHAASAALFTWAAWPARFFRWPIALISGGMLVATPLEGAHYLIDLVGGLGVAIIAICLVSYRQHARQDFDRAALALA